MADLLDNIGLGVVNTGLNWLSSAWQKSANEESADYMMQRYYSPQAQVRNLAAAGINPAVAFGNNAPVFSSGASLGNVSAPSVGIGTQSLSDIANYIRSVADAKKAGVDTQLSEQEIRNKEVERQAKEFELELKKYFGASDMVSKLALAWSDVALRQDEHSINEWKKISAQAVAAADEYQRDIVKKVLDNKDTELELSNELLRQRSETEKSQQVQNYSQASVNRELRRLNSALADVEEDTKTGRIQSLISEYEKNGWLNEADANEARLRASRLSDVEYRRDNNRLFKAVDDFTEWLKSKVKIFGK